MADCPILSDLPIKLRAELLQLNTLPNHYWVALSGGLDSSVLLHAAHVACHISPKFSVSAVHVHHNLHAEADQWASHCRQLCETLHIPYTLLSVNIDLQPGQSLEEAARCARYRALASCLATGEVMLVGHHQEDQAETVLLQLLRGAGLDGLCAMPAWMSWGKGFLQRPLLRCSRRGLRAYAKEVGLDWIEDSSNNDLRFDRNFIRQRIMPVLRERWPAVDRTFTRSAQHCADSVTLFSQQIRRDLASCLNQMPSAHMLSCNVLREWSFERQCAVLRAWLRVAIREKRLHQDNPLLAYLPSTHTLHCLVYGVVAAREDAQPLVQWNNLEVRRYRDILYLLDRKEHLPVMSEPIIWHDLQQPLRLPHHLGVLNFKGDILAQWQGGAVHVTFSQPGARYRLGSSDKVGRRRLKKLFQQWSVPPWQRHTIPLVCHGECLLAAVGCFVDPHFGKVTCEKKGSD